MKKPASTQWRTVYFQVDAARYQSLKEKCAQSTCRSLAEYLRKLILQEPVTVNYRNASLEDLITELSLTRRLLADAVRAFELSALNVSSVTGQQQLSSWLKTHESDRAQIVALIDQIHQYCRKTTYLWLQ